MDVDTGEAPTALDARLDEFLERLIKASLPRIRDFRGVSPKGFDGNVVLFGAEDHLPYERPPLSKEYLARKKTLADFTVDPADWYREHDVDLRLGTTVTTIDRGAHTVGFASAVGAGSCDACSPPPVQSSCIAACSRMQVRSSTP